MLNKFDEITNTLKINELFNKKEEEEKNKKCILTILAIVGGIALVAGIAFAVYKFVSKDDYEDFEDDYYDDLFDDVIDE